MEGHCFSHLERRCEWCCGEKVVDRVEYGTYGKVVKLYVGQRDGQWILTINPWIKGKPDNFKSITVEFVGEYRRSYRIEGDNPNPWCHYAIKLGGDTIMGRDLTKKCDQLIAEQLEEIPLGISASQPVAEEVDERDGNSGGKTLGGKVFGRFRSLFIRCASLFVSFVARIKLDD